MAPLSPTVMDGFAGGITDFVTGSDKDQYAEGDNLLVTRAEELFSRPGSDLFDVNNAQLPTGNQRVSSLWNFNADTALVAQSARRVFYYAAGWQELLGPTGNSFFSAGATTSRVTGGSWKGHLFLLNNESGRCMKMYRDSGGTYRAVTAGLPKFLSENAYSAFTQAGANIRDLANDIRTQFLDHYADAVRHPTAADTTSGVGIPAAITAASSLATTIALVTALQVAYKLHYTDAKKPTGSRAYHSNVLGAYPGEPNLPLQYAAAPTTWLEVAQCLNDLKKRYNWHLRSFAGHPSVGPDVVTAASLASTEEGPLFTDVSYSNIISFSNKLKAQYNAHLGNNDSHQYALESGSLAGAQDTTNVIALADATDFDSAVEMTCQIYAAYRAHSDDAALKQFILRGTTRTLLADRKKIDGITNASAGSLGSYADVAVGMYVDMIGGGTNFPAGTKIASIVGNNALTNTDNDNLSGADNTSDMIASFRKFHGVGGSTHNYGNDPTIASGQLQTAVTLYAASIAAPDLHTVLLDIATKYNYHDSALYYHTRANMHQMVLTDLKEFKEYGYAFVYRRSYTTYGGETFLNVSTPYYKTKYTVDAPDQNPTLITTLNQISNGVTDNYDTSGTYIDIYRTEDRFATYYLVGSVLNATDTFTDNVSDGDLTSGEKLYTDGGVLANDPPPLAKYMHIMENGRTFYGNVTQALDDGTTETVANRILEAVQDAPDSVPSGNFKDLLDPVTGISSVKTVPIVWTANGTYRIEGQFDEQGRGDLSAVAIDNKIGLKGSFSPVQVDGGVIFAGPDQFYFTDGYVVTPCSRSWPSRYATIVSTQASCDRILGVYDALGKRAHFACTGSGTENDRWYTIDRNFPIHPTKGGCWTQASNGTSFAPTALCLFVGQVIRGDSRGYVFKHDPSYTNDPKVDTSTAATGWAKKAIIYNYTSGAINFGIDAIRKWAPVIQMKFDNQGDLSCQPISINDEGRVTANLTPIRSRQGTYEIDERRYFPAGSLFCSNKQMKFTNANVVITKSDTLGLATLDRVAKTLTINAGTFPVDMVDQTVSFPGDGYTEQFTVTAQNGGNTVLTLADALGHLPASGATKWQISGIPKTERMTLHEYAIWAMGMGTNQTTSGVEGTGANA